MRLSLRWKIVGGFGLLLALIAVLGWVTLSLLTSLRSVQRGVFDEAIPGLVAVDEIVLGYSAQSTAVRGALLSSTQEPHLETFRREVEETDFWEEQARDLFESEEDQEDFDQLVEAGHDYQDVVEDQVIPLAISGERTQAFSILSGQGEVLISQVELQGELLRNSQQERVMQSESEARSRTRNAFLILLLVVIGALALGTFLAWVLPRRLARNISQLVEVTRAIGRGDFDQDVKIRSGDEVEELATRFGEMQAGLKRLQQLALQDRELEIAASIQQNLLQRTLPATPGVRILPLQRQANLVGGDWYDVEVAEDKLTLVIGDASGKGIGAALMSTVALSFLRAERALGSEMRRIVERTNEALLDATDPGSFTTLIYTTLDLRTGEARWLNMGHPAPFLLRTGGGNSAVPRGAYVEGPRNRALGWFQEPGYAEAVTILEPGDCLLFFTDGWLEGKAPNSEVFGEQRFAEAVMRLAPVGAADIGERLVEEVEQFAAGKLDDDLTMLVIEYLGTAVPRGSMQVQTGEQEWHSRR
ncbi:MAG TPA: SpoIIE family protein phosphatase [Actinomycetota bacterium]|nr:SpoIIE family protein phosphatase [Actinomycetota bacterium]